MLTRRKCWIVLGATFGPGSAVIGVYLTRMRAEQNCAAYCWIVESEILC